MSDDEYADDFEEYEGDNSKISEESEHKHGDDSFELADEECGPVGGGAQSAFEEIDFRDIAMGRQVGGGGVGIVYEGTFRGQPVALKTLFDPRVDATLKREYMDELEVMAQLHHPNIVAFFGACTVPPNLCFVMELCEMSLYQLLHQPGACGVGTRWDGEEIDTRSAAELLLGTAEVRAAARRTPAAGCLLRCRATRPTCMLAASLFARSPSLPPSRRRRPPVDFASGHLRSGDAVPARRGAPVHHSPRPQVAQRACRRRRCGQAL